MALKQQEKSLFLFELLAKKLHTRWDGHIVYLFSRSKQNETLLSVGAQGKEAFHLGENKNRT